MGLLGSFLGNDQRKDIAAANKSANQSLQQGYNQAYGDYSSAVSGYDPYVQSGQQANTFYSNALGLNGTDAQNQSISTLTSNPLFSGQLSQDSNALSRVLNAQGSSGGGKAQLAAQRVFQQTAGNWLDRYNTLGQQGLSATNAQGNALQSRGDLSMGYGATKAGNAINYGNALASSRNTGINNILGLAGTAASAAAAFSDIRLKRDIVRIGATPAGLPVYRFKYITGDDEHIGVMAQEAREIFPDAVFAAPNGFLMVDYARIG